MFVTAKGEWIISWGFPRIFTAESAENAGDFPFVFSANSALSAVGKLKPITLATPRQDGLGG